MRRGGGEDDEPDPEHSDQCGDRKGQHGPGGRGRGHTSKYAVRTKVRTAYSSLDRVGDDQPSVVAVLVTVSCFERWVTEILRGLASSATGMRKVSTPSA